MDDIFDLTDAVIVDDLYSNYTLGYKEGDGEVHIFCEWCDETICKLDYDLVKSKEDMDLYEMILDNHPSL